MIDRMLLPGDGMVAAEHDLTCADLRHQVAQRLGSEYQRVEIELVQIFGRLLLQLDVRVAILRRDETGVVGARRVGAEISAAMRGKDLEAGKAASRGVRRRFPRRWFWRLSRRRVWRLPRRWKRLQGRISRSGV